MPTRLATALFAGLFVLITAPAALAQQANTYTIQPDESKLWIDGTSNKSDWTVHADEMTGMVRMTPGEGAPSVEEVQFSVPSAKVLSHKSTIMDRLMHKTLMVTEHPEISYVLTSATPTEPTSGEGFALQTTGELTIAGATNEVEMLVEGKPEGDGTRFTGSHTLLLTDYGMTPPSAMFGALRTGDEVVISFDVVAVPASAEVTQGE